MPATIDDPAVLGEIEGALKGHGVVSLGFEPRGREVELEVFSYRNDGACTCWPPDQASFGGLTNGCAGDVSAFAGWRHGVAQAVGSSGPSAAARDAKKIVRHSPQGHPDAGLYSRLIAVWDSRYRRSAKRATCVKTRVLFK
jgi:hypothetical protein